LEKSAAYEANLSQYLVYCGKVIVTFVTMDSIRQRQLAKTIQVALSENIQKELSNILEGAMITISGVRVTPDLYIARVYVSIYNHANPTHVLALLDKNNKYIRGLLGNKLRNKVRSVPQLEFFKDDTLDEVQKLEQIFKEIKEKDAQIAKDRDGQQKA
jgi:ribosome-binding factor A